MPFRQLKSFLKILIGVQYDTQNSLPCGRLFILVNQPKNRDCRILLR